MNPLGPLHDQDDPALELRFNVPPIHTGPLLEAVAVNAALTVTDVVAVDLQPDALVTTTV